MELFDKVEKVARVMFMTSLFIGTAVFIAGILIATAGLLKALIEMV